MTMYNVRYVHKIFPKDTDRSIVTIPETSFSDKKLLAKSLRKNSVLPMGVSIREMRVEGDKVVIFPTKCCWHSITIEEA